MLLCIAFKVKAEMVVALAGDIHLARRCFQDDPVPGNDMAQRQGRRQPGPGKGCGQALGNRRRGGEQEEIIFPAEEGQVQGVAAQIRGCGRNPGRDGDRGGGDAGPDAAGPADMVQVGGDAVGGVDEGRGQALLGQEAAGPELGPGPELGLS